MRISDWSSDVCSSDLVPAGTPSAKVQNYFLSFAYQKPRLIEYRMNLKTGETAERFLSDQLVEMPCINNRFMGLKTRYAYNTLVSETPLFLMSGIQKWDFEAMAEVDQIGRASCRERVCQYV